MNDEINYKNQFITEQLFGECWHVKIPSPDYATYCKKCSKRIEQSHQTGFDRNYDFYGNSKDRQKLLAKISEMNLQDAFISEFSATAIPFDGGFDAVYLWGLFNITSEKIADAVVSLLEKQAAEKI